MDSPRYSHSSGKSGSHEQTDIKATSSLVNLPLEITLNIFQSLAPLDLNSVSLTCRKLRHVALDDLLWKPHVLTNLPGFTFLSSPSPFDSYRELYWSHGSHWFVAKRKVWISDERDWGGLFVAGFNTSTGHIEGFKIVARTGNQVTLGVWKRDPRVQIYSFDPVLAMHRRTPAFDISPKKRFDPVPNTVSPEKRLEGHIQKPWHSRGIYMPPVYRSTQHSREVPHLTHLQFFLAQALESSPQELEPTTPIWPPRTIPAPSYSLTTRPPTMNSREEICQYAFWLAPKDGASRYPWRTSSLWHQYGSMDLEAYTPTQDFPFKGIWVGDYSAHGSEFLLIKQDDSSENVQTRNVRRKPCPVRKQNETESAFKARMWEHTLASTGGRLEAVKLTGDHNVPRGEVTFYADDICNVGDDGGVVGEDDFKVWRQNGEIHGNGRIVKGKGHIALEGFVSGKQVFTPSAEA